MQALKTVWRRQDGVNRAILLSGTVLAIVCLAVGRGFYGIVTVALMGLFCVAHQSGRARRLSRLYGSLFYHAPDGEIVPVTFEQVCAEYGKGKGMRYMERKVTVRYPFWRRNDDGELETGFGLCIRLDGFEDREALLPRLRSGNLISVAGELIPDGRRCFYMGNVTEIRRISEKEVRMV